MNCQDCDKPLTEPQLRQHATRCRPCARREWHKQRRANHPLARTIDHILPLAMGGDDTRANVQLAHWYCNQQKSTRGSQQLRLVG